MELDGLEQKVTSLAQGHWYGGRTPVPDIRQERCLSACESGEPQPIRKVNAELAGPVL